MANDAYKKFLTAAKNAQMLNEFSAKELEIAGQNPEFGTALLGLKQDYKNATTEEGRGLAHAAAEQLREKYRYQTPATAAPTVTGGYPDSVDYSGTLARLEQMNYPDWQKGSSYKDLEKQYIEQGQKTMDDTLARISTRTGGLASSYAGQAAQEAYDDTIEQLPVEAYSRYLNERGDVADLLQMQMTADGTAYQRALDRLETQRQSEAQNYERAMLERAEAQETVNSMIAMGATLADIPQDLLIKSGYSQSYVNVGNRDYIRQTAPKVSTAAPADNEAEPLYGEQLSKGQVSELLSKYGKNKTLSAEEWDALGRMGYELDYESGKIKLVENTEAETEGNPALYQQMMTGFKTMQSYESKDRMREMLLQVMDQLSEEEVESLMETFGL